jgi:gliding motility-associated-like protein
LAPSITPITGFSYDSSSYCANAANATPELADGFSEEGTFSATPSGLAINPETGVITVSASASGTYTVTYAVAADAGTCRIAASSSTTVVISGELSFEIDSVCESDELVLKVVDPTFDSGMVTYTWTDGEGEIIEGETGPTLNVDQYRDANPSLEFPLTFNLLVSSGECSSSIVSRTVTSNPCLPIQKGISPSNDGNNDTFNLKDLGAKEVTIYNRYGLKVYSFTGNYVDQWDGRSDSGEELPDATYFYSIQISDGSTRTGWIYINREY